MAFRMYGTIHFEFFTAIILHLVLVVLNHVWQAHTAEYLRPPANYS